MHALSAIAQDHFEHPRYAGSLSVQDADVAAVRVGAPIGGEILQLHLRIDACGVICTVRFKAYGCGWMIACGSLLCELMLGQTLTTAVQFRHHALVERLAAPPEKLHCAVLAETALKAALCNNAAKQNFTVLSVSAFEKR